MSTTNYQVISNSQEQRIEAVTVTDPTKYHNLDLNGITTQLWGSQSLLYIALFLTRAGYIPTGVTLENSDRTVVDADIHEEVSAKVVGFIASDSPERFDQWLRVERYSVNGVTLTANGDVISISREGLVTVESADPQHHIAAVLKKAAPESSFH